MWWPFRKKKQQSSDGIPPEAPKTTCDDIVFGGSEVIEELTKDMANVRASSTEHPPFNKGGFAEDVGSILHPKPLYTSAYCFDFLQNTWDSPGIPVITIRVPPCKAFDLFREILETLPEMVEVLLETSHSSAHHRDTDLHKIDTCVLISTLIDFEDLLSYDTHTGIAIKYDDGESEIQWTEKKFISHYSYNLRDTWKILQRRHIPYYDGTRGKLLPARPYQPKYKLQFQELASRLGIEVPSL